MKYRIRWHGRNWVLQYYWPDEGGGGWTTCWRSRFRWVLRYIAPMHKWFDDRSVKRCSYREEWEL